MENFKIISEKINPLFGRKEIQATVDSEVTPSKQEVEKLLIEKLSTTSDVLKLEKIKGKFGSKTFEITAKIYKSEQDKNQIETKTKKQRDAEKKVDEEAKKAEIEKKKKQAEETVKVEETTEEIKQEKKTVEEVKEEQKQETQIKSQSIPASEHLSDSNKEKLIDKQNSEPQGGEANEVKK